MDDYEVFREKFSDIRWLLLNFNSDISGSKKEAEIIAGFVKTLKDSAYVKEIIEQGRQFLALDEFPVKLIESLTGRLPSLIEGCTKHILEPTKENYYHWVKWIIEEVEEEAKRQGKL